MKLESLFKKQDLLESYNKEAEKTSPIEALVFLSLKNNLSVDELSKKLIESAPKNKNSEKFIKDAKKSFKDRYGKNWEKVLYATAWKKFKEEKECELSEQDFKIFDENKEDVNSVLMLIKSLVELEKNKKINKIDEGKYQNDKIKTLKKLNLFKNKLKQQSIKSLLKNISYYKK